jgi:hypothetical protein
MRTVDFSKKAKRGWSQFFNSKLDRFVVTYTVHGIHELTHLKLNAQPGNTKGEVSLYR